MISAATRPARRSQITSKSLELTSEGIEVVFDDDVDGRLGDDGRRRGKRTTSDIGGPPYGAYLLKKRDEVDSESLHGFHECLDGRPLLVVTQQFRDGVLREVAGMRDRLLCESAGARRREMRRVVRPNLCPIQPLHHVSRISLS